MSDSETDTPRADGGVPSLAIAVKQPVQNPNVPPSLSEAARNLKTISRLESGACALKYARVHAALRKAKNAADMALRHESFQDK